MRSGHDLPLPVVLALRREASLPHLPQEAGVLLPFKTALRTGQYIGTRRTRLAARGASEEIAFYQ